MSDPAIDLTLLVVAVRRTNGAWQIRCGDAIAEVRPNGDRFGAHELVLPKVGLRIQRALSEAVAITLIEEGFVRQEARPTNVIPFPAKGGAR